MSVLFAHGAGAYKITMPDVLMIVAMATSFCSERKMSRVRERESERERVSE